MTPLIDISKITMAVMALRSLSGRMMVIAILVEVAVARRGRSPSVTSTGTSFMSSTNRAGNDELDALDEARDLQGSRIPFAAG